MNLQRFQGLALIVSAVCFLLGLFDSAAATFLVIIGIILFILSIPAVYLAQPAGWLGLAGIALLVLSSLIALVFRLSMVPSSIGSSLALTSAFAGMLGAVIVGWLTVREHVFPAWIGWAFIAQGLLNFIAGLVDLGSLAESLPLFLTLLLAVVLFTYGYFIYQKQINAPIGNESKVPLG